MHHHAEGQGRRVRQTYERYPYPDEDGGWKPSQRWRLPPVAWLNAMWKPGSGRFLPRRVLVAGCGTGREAFAIADRIPSARVVAVDFSPRSIAIARRDQRRLGIGRRLRFVVGDLNDRVLPDVTGGDFDFISCHGVLSYVARPERVLEQLTRCLSVDGALYLGVNGETHHSARWRAALPAFGLDPSQWRENEEARRVLGVLDAMAEQTPAPRLARRSAAYLASDVFGPPIRNWPLDRWLTLTQNVGLHFRGSHSCVESLKGLCEKRLVCMLIPRSRAEHHALEERLIPSAFHRLVLTRGAPSNAPWNDPRELLNWSPVTLGLYRNSVQARRPARGWRQVRLASTALDLLVEMPLETWVCEMLRKPHRGRLADFADGLSTRRRQAECRDTIYTLYLLGVLEMMPPAPREPNGASG